LSEKIGQLRFLEQKKPNGMDQNIDIAIKGGKVSRNAKQEI